MTVKQQAINALSTVLSNQKNITIFEKNIRNITEDDDEYIRIVYQVVGDIIQKNMTLSQQIVNIKQGNVGWSHPCYDKIQSKIDEHDNFIVKPFEVAEGVVECGKCNSNKTWSYTKQVKRSDEPATLFATCINCRNQWTQDA